MIEPGDVLFVWSDSLIGGLIEEITDGPSHCAMFVSSDTVCEAQFDKLIGEVSLKEYLDNPKNGRLEVWTDPNLTAEARAKMVNYARTLYGEHYDTILIPLEYVHELFQLDIGWYHEGNTKICSTYTGEVAKHEGFIWSDEPAPTPADLMKYGALKLKEVLKCGTVSSEEETN